MRKEIKQKAKDKRNIHPSEHRVPKKSMEKVLSEQRKEIEENKRMGKTRDLVQKIKGTKGTFYEKMSRIKDINVKVLTEAEAIKKRGKNTQNCTKMSNEIGKP